MIIDGKIFLRRALRWNLGWPTPNYGGAFFVTLLAGGGGGGAWMDGNYESTYQNWVDELFKPDADQLGGGGGVDCCATRICYLWAFGSNRL